MLIALLFMGVIMQSAAWASGRTQSSTSSAPLSPPSSPSEKRPDWEVAAGAKMEFDVASVKQDTAALSPQTVHSNVPLGPQDLFSPTGGFFSSANFPLTAYLTFAYKLTPNQFQTVITQLPKWANENRYDIEARAGGNPTKDQYRLMVQALLADRFKLVVHYETKQTAVLALVLDKPGKLGPKIRPHPDDSACSTAVPTARGPVPRTADGFPEPCGALAAWPSSTPGRTVAGARNVPMSMLADTFSAPQISGADKPVVDRTGLTGRYDFLIEFSPQVPPGANFQPDPNGPTFLEALKEQLGFKFEQQTGPVDVIVVDHVEQPSEN